MVQINSKRPLEDILVPNSEVVIGCQTQAGRSGASILRRVDDVESESFISVQLQADAATRCVACTVLSVKKRLLLKIEICSVPACSRWQPISSRYIQAQSGHRQPTSARTGSACTLPAFRFLCRSSLMPTLAAFSSQSSLANTLSSITR